MNLNEESPNNSWTKFPNSFLDNLDKFTPSEFKVLGLMVRKNNGYKNPNKKFSKRYTSKKLKMSETTVTKATNNLIKNKHIKIIGKDENGTFLYEIIQNISKESKKIIPILEYSEDKDKNTQNYINNYLSIGKSWPKGIPLKDKWNNIFYNPSKVIEINIETFIKSIEYDNFLKTLYWKTIADYKKSQSSHKCQSCNSKKSLHVHHETYEIRGREIHNLDKLIVLCKQCHENIHGITNRKVI